MSKFEMMALRANVLEHIYSKMQDEIESWRRTSRSSGARLDAFPDNAEYEQQYQRATLYVKTYGRIADYIEDLLYKAD